MGTRMATWARKAMRGFRAALVTLTGPSNFNDISRLFGWGSPNYSGVEVTETSSLGFSGVWRAVNLVSGTLAQLPLKTYRETAPGTRQQMKSLMDDPGAVLYMTAFEWKRLVFTHLLLHGNAYLRHIYGGASQLLALQPVHPECVRVRLPAPGENPAGGKWFDITLADGTRETLDATTLTHVMGFTTDGFVGASFIQYARNSIGTGIAGDRAAARVFSTGALVSGIVTPGDERGFEDAEPIKASINNAMTGWENNGGIAVLNQNLKFQQVSMSAVDAQFLESRRFSIEDVARWFGVPPFLLMQMDKQSSWAASVEGQQIGMGRTVLAPWAKLLEEKLSVLLQKPRWVEFDFSMLERPTPDREIELLKTQIECGLLTLNEARAIRNMPPVEGGDVVKGVQAPTPAPEPAPDATAEPDPEAVANA
jgi:HK97 family phage portal protein